MTDSGNSDIPPPTEQDNKPNKLRDRIAAAIEAQHVSEYQGGIHPEDVLRVADAVIAELALEPQSHYDPDCDYYRYVTDWINPVTGNKIDLP